MVSWQCAFVHLRSDGTTLGLSVGAFLGWALVRPMASEGTGALVSPVGSLFTATALAAIAGVAAALMPARLAARIDILTAVANA